MRSARGSKADEYVESENSVARQAGGCVCERRTNVYSNSPGSCSVQEGRCVCRGPVSSHGCFYICALCNWLIVQLLLTRDLDECVCSVAGGCCFLFYSL